MARRALPHRCAIFPPMQRLSFILFLSLLLAAPLAARDDLYRGEARDDQRGTSQRDGMLVALNQVLIRLTGKVGDDPVAEAALDRSAAEAFSIGREFVQVEVPRADGTVRRERRLQVVFDPAAVDQLIDEQGWPRWSGKRPVLLLWVAQQQDGSAEYADDDARLGYLIEEASARYGLELVRPILDGADRMEVQPVDIRGGFIDQSAAAVQRYGADGVVMLDLREDTGLASARWVWKLGQREQSFQMSGAGQAELVDLGLARVAAALAQRLAVVGDTTSQRRLVISGIEAVAHYIEVERFLSSLDGIESIRLAVADGDQLQFELVVRGGELRERIETAGPLVFENRQAMDGTLYYRFER